MRQRGLSIENEAALVSRHHHLHHGASGGSGGSGLAGNGSATLASALGGSASASSSLSSSAASAAAAASVSSASASSSSSATAAASSSPARPGASMQQQSHQLARKHSAAAAAAAARAEDQPSCSSFCQYWPIGVAVTPVIVIVYFCTVVEGWSLTWIVWLNFYTFCLWAFTGTVIDVVNRACCPAGRRVAPHNLYMVKGGVAILIGVLVMVSASFRIGMGGVDSKEWVRQHQQSLDDSAHINFLHDLAPPTYIVTAGPNVYRNDLVTDLRKFGVPEDDIHFVPAVMAEKCKMVGEAGKAELERSFLFDAWAVMRNAFLGDICYDACMFRCYGDNYCPEEKSAEHYQTIACQSSQSVESPATHHRLPSAAARSKRAAAAARRLAATEEEGERDSEGEREGDHHDSDDDDARGAPEALDSKRAESRAGELSDEDARRLAAKLDSAGAGGDDINDADTEAPAGRARRAGASGASASAEPQQQKEAQRQAERAAADTSYDSSRVRTLRARGGGKDRAVTPPKTPEPVAVEVIDAKTAGDSQFDIRINASNTFLHRGDALRELAVAASHLKAIHAAYSAGEDFALILEDDASMSLLPLWHNVGLREAMLAVPHDWHVIQLHVWLGGEMGIGAKIVDKMLHRLAVGEIVSKRHMVHDAEFWGAVAYVVSREGMRAILDEYWGGWDVANHKGFPKRKSALQVAAESQPQPSASSQTGAGAGAGGLLHRQAKVTPPFVEPELPFLDLTQNPLSDILVYSAPNTYVVNRPLFAHQLGNTHWTNTHTGGLGRHEDDRRRLLHFFYERYVRQAPAPASASRGRRADSVLLLWLLTCHRYDEQLTGSFADEEDLRFFMKLSNTYVLPSHCFARLAFRRPRPTLRPTRPSAHGVPPFVFILFRPCRWILRTLDSVMGNILYFLDPFVALIYVVYAHFFYVPVLFYYQSGRPAPPCCCDARTGATRKLVGGMCSVMRRAVPRQHLRSHAKGPTLERLKAHM